MRKIIAITQLTLDGVMQAPGGPEEDPSNGFTHGGWFMSFGDEILMKVLVPLALAVATSVDRLPDPENAGVA